MYYCYQELSEKEEKTAEKKDRYTGTVTWKVYFEFWKAGAGIPMLLLLIILIIGTQVNQGTWLTWHSITYSSGAQTVVIKRPLVVSGDLLCNISNMKDRV